jgi:hypothetical protein
MTPEKKAPKKALFLHLQGTVSKLPALRNRTL